MSSIQLCAAHQATSGFDGDAIVQYMRTDFITLQEHLSVHEAREHFISQLASDDIPGQVFVVAGKKLRGSLSVKKLLQETDINQSIRHLMDSCLFRVKPDDERQQVIAELSERGLDLVPVVDKGELVGCLMEKEIAFLGNAVENPVRPFVAILGGAKVADKLNVINNLLEKCDTLIIGGGMAYTFLKAQGYEIGLSLVDDSKLDYCKEMMEKAEKLGKKLLLPVDAVTIKDFPNPIDAPVEVEVYDSDKMPADREGCDIGPKTQALFADAVKTAKTVVWNGPMGVFENPTLAAGTIAVAKALADTDATTIIGGGDSAAAVNQLGFGDKMTHISTGGGASLEFLEGKELPGVAAANDK